MVRSCRIALVRLCLLLAWAPGCGGYHLQSSGPQLEAPKGESFIKESWALSLDEVRVYEYGVRYSPRASLIDRITGALRTSDVFDSVYGPEEAHLAPENRARVTCWIDTDLDKHELSNIYAGLAVVLTFGVLSPVLHQRFEVRQKVECTLLLPPRRLRTYSSSAAGSLSHNSLFPRDVEGEVMTTVTEKNVTGVIGMIVDDFVKQ